MNYINHTLSNVLLPNSEDPLGGWDLYIKPAEGAQCKPEDAGVSLQGEVDFFTYFNACSLVKWKKYAEINRVWLHLEFVLPKKPASTKAASASTMAASAKAASTSAKAASASTMAASTKAASTSTKAASAKAASASGQPASEFDCTVQFFGRSFKDSQAQPLGDPIALTQEQDAKTEALTFDLLFPETNHELVAFTLNAQTEVQLVRAHYYTSVPEDQVNPVKIALSTTTFMKEDYIVPNIELVRAEILGCEEPIAKNFHMFVIDNGRTLDAQALSGGGVSVLPNPNTGGAGGFARGMIEALKSPERFTHVLLMDDDVKISPESLKRTYNLLSLVKGKYKNAFVNGAMLIAEEPNRQFEDVSYVVNSGAYYKVKSDKYYMDKQRHIVRNEHINVEVPNAYGAWWFSCVPVSEIKRIGLPLPMFVRCDDVEYGMRAKPIYMTMNGICVWHDGFLGRSKASVDSYQYARNFLIMTAMTDCASQDVFMMRMERGLRLQLRVMAYDAAELLLDGIEDYLKGPEYFASLNGEEVMKRNGAKNEKMIPLEELDPEYQNLAFNQRMLGDNSYIKIPLKLLRSLPYDRHLLPDALLRNKPQAIFYTGLTLFAPQTMAAKTLVAIDLDGNNAAVRHMDRDRYHAILYRYHLIKAQMKARGAEVRQAYKDAQPYLTSVEFWEKYLGLND